MQNDNLFQPGVHTQILTAPSQENVKTLCMLVRSTKKGNIENLKKVTLEIFRNLKLFFHMCNVSLLSETSGMQSDFTFFIQKFSRILSQRPARNYQDT